MAPGVVKTPLWTDHEEKLKAVGSGDGWVSAADVAAVMVALVERDEVGDVIAENAAGGAKIVIRGGSILEVSKGRVRDVQAFDDPGPGDRVGNMTSNMWKLEEEVWSALDMKGWGAL